MEPAAPAAAPPPQQQRPSPAGAPWETVLHLVLPHLGDEDHPVRCAVRLVSREWRAAADATWRRAAFDCTGYGPALLCGTLHSTGAFLLQKPQLRELWLVGLADAAMVWRALTATPGLAPGLCSLALSAPLGAQADATHPPGAILQPFRPLWAAERHAPRDGPADGATGAPQGSQLQQLQLHDVVFYDPLHGPHLEMYSALTALAELAVSMTCGPGQHHYTAMSRVGALAKLPALQVLELPKLDEAGRDALSLLTSLTRLRFVAAGKGAVGPSLTPLTRLQHLAVVLWHQHEHFIVLHPSIDWAVLRCCTSLRRLAVEHLAANTFFAAPELPWTQAETPVALEADLLVAALPDVHDLQLRLSFCRLAEEHATGGEPQRLVVPHPCTGTPRSFGRTIERAPVRQPMQRRSDEWFDAWWQEPCLQRAPPAAAAGPAAAGDDAAHRFLAECGESAGWAAIRPGNHRTFDVVVRYWRQGGRPCS